MTKKLLVFILVLSISILGVCPYFVHADNVTKSMVEQIIAGNQDLLVFANIIEKGTSAYEVQILEEIGLPHGKAETGKENEPASESDLRINVEGFINYMYYDDHNYRPQKGDNVLLSLRFNGNSYTIKNGAFRVDLASRDQFSFMVPESVNGSSEALELSALYIYIKSNGETDNLSIKDGAVYGKDANGADEKLEIVGKLKFIDDAGDITEKPSVAEIYGTDMMKKTESKWELVLVILSIGMVLGVFIVKIVNKLEKRSELK